MEALFLFVTTALSYVPKLIEIGEDVAPMVSAARTALTGLKDGGGITADQFTALDAQLAPFEAQIQQLAAAAQQAIDAEAQKDGGATTADPPAPPAAT